MGSIPTTLKIRECSSVWTEQCTFNAWGVGPNPTIPSTYESLLVPVFFHLFSVEKIKMIFFKMKKLYIIILLLIIIGCSDPVKEIFDQRHKSRIMNKEKFLNRYGSRSEKHKIIILRDKVCKGMTLSDVILSISHLYDKFEEDKMKNYLLLFGIKNHKKVIIYYFREDKLVKWKKLKR